MKVSGRTILITGGTSGIGFELAKQLLERKNTVLITGRDAKRLEQAKEKLPSLHTFGSDVSDVQSIKDLYRDVVAAFPALDLLINNAGEMRDINFNHEHDLTDLTREIETNLCGPIRMSQQFIPHLKKQQQACIVNVSSGLAFVPYPISPVYCATKAGLHSFSCSLRLQLADTNISVVELAPPGVETPLYHNITEGSPKAPKGMDVKVLAKSTIEGLESDQTEITPGLSKVLKFMSRLAPGLILSQMDKTCRPAKGWAS